MTDYAVLAIAVVLLVLGYVLGIGILVTLGWIALVIGLVLVALALAGRSAFNRRGRL
jgi:hypothetical protein